VVLLAASFEGYMYRVGRLQTWARIGIGIGGLLMLVPESVTDYVGLGIGLASALASRAARRSNAVSG